MVAGHRPEAGDDPPTGDGPPQRQARQAPVGWPRPSVALELQAAAGDLGGAGVLPMSGGPAGQALSRSRLPGHPARSFCESTAYGSCRTRGRRQERVAHRSLDGAQSAPTTGSTGAAVTLSLFNEKAAQPELLSKWRDEGTQSYFLKWLDRLCRSPVAAGGKAGPNLYSRHVARQGGAHVAPIIKIQGSPDPDRHGAV